MIEAPSTGALADAAGISKSYASEIVNDKRDPSRPLAIHILRRTGWRHKILTGLSEAQLSTLETIEPWIAPADRPDTTTEQAAAA